MTIAAIGTIIILSVCVCVALPEDQNIEGSSLEDQNIEGSSSRCSDPVGMSRIRTSPIQSWRAQHAEQLASLHNSRCSTDDEGADHSQSSNQVSAAAHDIASQSVIESKQIRLLVVDLSFGGLSNRRQALMQAVAAAKILGRALVLGDEFDPPHPVLFPNPS